MTMTFVGSHETYWLPVGYRDHSGRLHRQLSLRKMTGAEEALLYDSSLNPGQLVSELLAACTVRLGDVERVDRSITRNMHVSDRNFTLLELRRLTLGDRVVARYDCTRCSACFSLVEDLSKIPVARLPDDAPLEHMVVELEDGYRDEDGTVHRRVTLGAPLGADEEFVAGFAGREPLRARDALVLRCIRSFGQLPQAVLDGCGVEILRALALADRRRITAALDELTLGPDFTRRIRCPHCTAEFGAVLDASSFFVDG